MGIRYSRCEIVLTIKGSLPSARMYLSEEHTSLVPNLPDVDAMVEK
jgi:hypothetical protein